MFYFVLSRLDLWVQVLLINHLRLEMLCIINFKESVFDTPPWQHIEMLTMKNRISVMICLLISQLISGHLLITQAQYKLT